MTPDQIIRGAGDLLPDRTYSTPLGGLLRFNRCAPAKRRILTDADHGYEIQEIRGHWYVSALLQKGVVIPLLEMRSGQFQPVSAIYRQHVEMAQLLVSLMGAISNA